MGLVAGSLLPALRRGFALGGDGAPRFDATPAQAVTTRVDLASFQQGDYTPGAPFAKQLAWFFCNALVLQSRIIPSSGLRVALLRAFGASVGRGAVIKPGVSVKFPWRLTIGENAWIGERVWIDNLATVTIGHDACISQDAYLLTGSHNYARSTFDLVHRDVIIEPGAWIGARAVVCPGVRVGVESVLAVGSIATRDLEPHGVYQGNPAAWKRKREISITPPRAPSSPR